MHLLQSYMDGIRTQRLTPHLPSFLHAPCSSPTPKVCSLNGASGMEGCSAGSCTPAGPEEGVWGLAVVDSWMWFYVALKRRWDGDVGGRGCKLLRRCLCRENRLQGCCRLQRGSCPSRGTGHQWPQVPGLQTLPDCSSLGSGPLCSGSVSRVSFWSKVSEVVVSQVLLQDHLGA